MISYRPLRLPAGARSSPPGPLLVSLRIAVAGIAALYPLALAAIACAMRYVGEKWWLTGVALYLPRIGFALPLPLLVVALAALGLYRWLWTQLVAFFVLLFPLMGLTLARPRPSDARAPTLRILSYNVNSGFGGVDRVVEEIDRYSPDIVFLQEVGHGDLFIQTLEKRYPTVKWSTQFIMATRYPVLSVVDPERLPYEGRQRSPRYEHYVLDTALGPIALYNVHPISPRGGLSAIRGQGLRREVITGRLFLSPNVVPFMDETGLRVTQVKDFVAAASAETLPVIVAGDTNLPDLSPLLANNLLSRYTDGFRAAGRGFGYTFPVDQGRQPWMRIDRVFASPGLHFVHFEVGHSRASDHLCVVADLQKEPL